MTTRVPSQWARLIRAALMGDPSHGPSVGVERAGMQRDGGGA